MVLSRAVVALNEGKQVRRDDQAVGSFFFLKSSNRKKYLFKSTINPSNVREESPAVMYWDDLNATNWSVTQ